VALRACDAGVLACERKMSVCVVIEARSRPLRRGVALRAVLRKSRGDVVWILCRLVIRQVASHTSRIQSGEDVVRVALSAAHRDVSAGEGKLRLTVVIEGSPLPRRGRMTLLASGRESSRDMVWRLRRLVNRQMARRARSGQPGEDVVGMALGTTRGCVRTGQPELRLTVVIEGRPLPFHGRMALGALHRESRHGMIRVRRVLVITQMAGATGRVEPAILAVRVTLGTGRVRVCAGQRKTCEIVIELRPLPLHSGVAGLAILRKSGGGVIGSIGSLVILLVTPDAGRVQTGENAVGVTLGAAYRSVRAGEREPRLCVVVELRAIPLCGRVAGGTILRKACCYVVGCRCSLIVFLVAPDAGGVQAGKDAIDVTLGARR
jgi:hypothetical protein